MKLLIVNFHYIRDKKYQSGIYPRTLSELSNQIDSISKHYKFISQENLISQLLNKSISKNAKYCLLTFDDGLKEQMEAFKMLIKKGIPAVFFVNTKPIKNNTVADVHKLHHIRSKLCDEEILKLIKPIHKVDNFNYPSNINQLYRYDSTDAKKLKYLFNFGLEPEVKALVIKNIFNNYFDETSLSRELYMNGDDIITLSNSDALVLQSTVSKLREKRGEEVIGYKIGCVLKETQKKMGFTQPAWGTLWKNELHDSGVKLNKKDYSNPAMEAEFGIILDRDLKPESITNEYILNSVKSIYPLIEIHNLVFHGDAPHGAELLANNAIHAGVILGSKNKSPNKNLTTDLKLIYDKEIVDTWSNKKWPDDMLSEIKWLVNEQAKTKNILKKDSLILTGAYGFPIPINNKKIIEVTSSKFGNVNAEFN